MRFLGVLCVLMAIGACDAAALRGPRRIHAIDNGGSVASSRHPHHYVATEPQSAKKTEKPAKKLWREALANAGDAFVQQGHPTGLVVGRHSGLLV